MQTEKKYRELSLYPVDYPFKTLIDNIRDKQLILNPSFQRKYKRDKDWYSKPSKFIESCLMRIPLPVAYFSEEDNGTYLVIDGVQRLTTILHFIDNKFALEDLLVFDNLNGKKFDELDIVYQRDLLNYTMRCIVLRRDNPKYIISDIFARLNQWGVSLSPQEIRNAIYPWSLNSLLKELWKEETIQKFWLIDKWALWHEELVLRFFAMKWDLWDYEDKLHKYLDIFMIKNQNIDELEINELKKLFLNTLNKCLIVFWNNVFINPSKERKKQSIVYYDLLMHSFANIEESKLEKKKDLIRENFLEMCKKEEFTKTLSWWTQQKSQILKRRSIRKSYLDQIMN